MYPAVKSVVPTEDYRLSVAFDNGECGILNMKPFLDFGIFRRLKDPNAFKRVRVAFDTIEWESGIDLDPEFVYEKCERKTYKAKSKPSGCPLTAHKASKVKTPPAGNPLRP